MQIHLPWWCTYTDLRRCYLPGCNAWQRTEVFHTYQVFSRNVLSSSMPYAFCVPRTIRRHGENTSQCVRNKSNWLLQQCFHSCRSDSFSSATITSKCVSMTNRKKGQVWPNHSNLLRCAALATSSVKNQIQALWQCLWSYESYCYGISNRTMFYWINTPRLC